MAKMKRKVVLTDAPSERIKLTDAPARRFSHKAFAEALGAEEIGKVPRGRGSPASFVATRWGLFRRHGILNPPTLQPWRSSQSFKDLELLLAKVAASVATPDYAPSIEETALEVLRKALNETTDADLAEIRRRLEARRESSKHTKE